MRPGVISRITSESHLTSKTVCPNCSRLLFIICVIMFYCLYVCLKPWAHQYWTPSSASDGAWMHWPTRELCCRLMEFHSFFSATALSPVIMGLISTRRQRLDSEIAELLDLWVTVCLMHFYPVGQKNTLFIFSITLSNDVLCW